MPLLGRKQALLIVEIPRLQCKLCGHIWWPQLSFASGKAQHTHYLALTVLDLLRFGTIEDVAKYLRISWNLIKEIHKQKLTSMYRRISLAGLKYLGVDEFSIKKNHRYMTIFVDLQTGQILHAVEGRDREAISPFLRKLKRRARNLKAIAMYMSISYASAVKDILPTTPVVFDRYHIMALMNKRIDQLRRELQNSLDRENKRFIKGTRLLLLKNYSDIGGDGRLKLDLLLQTNAPLYEAHTMKEQLRLFWLQKGPKEALSYLVRWILDAMKSDVKQLLTMASTLIEHFSGVMHYYPHQITTGLLEGINNKIKTKKRQAYGFRDSEYFKLRLYDLHTSRYAF